VAFASGDVIEGAYVDPARTYQSAPGRAAIGREPV